MAASKLARRYWVSGRVQGVGYRNFAQHAANLIGIRGYAKNLEDGRVEVFAMGTSEQLDAYYGKLTQGPRFAEVRHIEQKDDTMLDYEGFHIKA